MEQSKPCQIHCILSSATINWVAAIKIFSLIQKWVRNFFLIFYFLTERSKFYHFKFQNSIYNFVLVYSTIWIVFTKSEIKKFADKGSLIIIIHQIAGGSTINMACYMIWQWCHVLFPNSNTSVVKTRRLAAKTNPTRSWAFLAKSWTETAGGGKSIPFLFHGVHLLFSKAENSITQELEEKGSTLEKGRLAFFCFLSSL